MTPSPFARMNDATLREDRRRGRPAWTTLAGAAFLAVAVVMLAHMVLGLAVQMPDIIATSAARAAW